MRIAIIGKAQSGKTTFANFLSKYLDLKTSNTSDWLIEVEKLRRERLASFLPEMSECSKFDKEQNRSWLMALGDAVCAIQPDFLIEQAFKRGDIITGIRRKEEYKFLDKSVITIYIDRESLIRDNFDIPKNEARYIILNNLTLEALDVKAKDLAKIIKDFN